MPCARAATRGGAFPFLLLCAADGLSVDGDHQPAACLHGPRPQPRTEDPGEHIRADHGATGRRKVDSSAGPRTRAECGQGLRAGVGGPPPDRGERPRTPDHRRDPDGQQPSQRMPAAALLPGVRDLGKETEEVLAPGSRNKQRCHRRADLPRGRR
jgi:hypothetical protein